MSVGIITGLLFAAISINMIAVVCSIKTAEAGTSKSEKIMSVQGRSLIKSFVDGIEAIKNRIYPGTKWCGDINTAENDDDFGTSEQTDRCCKEHDGCETFITAGDTKYGLKNTASYSVSDCTCDQKLLDCIYNVMTSEDAPEADKSTATNYETFFLRISNPKCLLYDYPIVCVSKESGGNCNKYEYDKNQPIVWQLVDDAMYEFLSDQR